MVVVAREADQPQVIVAQERRIVRPRHGEPQGNPPLPQERRRDLGKSRKIDGDLADAIIERL